LTSLCSIVKGGVLIVGLTCGGRGFSKTVTGVETEAE
jgi:hypothetical protein